MKKVTLNIATDKTKKLIGYLADLEASDRDRMSSSGREYMDKVWELLGLPTYDKLINHDDITSSDLDDNGTLIEEEEWNQ